MSKKRSRHVAASVATAALAIAHARPAAAQGAGDLGPFTGPSPGRPHVENSPDSGYQPHESRRSVKLFDQYKSTVSYQLDIGPIWARRVQDETPITQRRNFERGAPLAGEIGFGTVFTTPSFHGPLYLVGHLKTLFRILDDKSFSWGLFHQELGGGLKLGPFEPEVRMRLTVMSVDIMHAQPSVQLLSPGVSVGVGVHLGNMRVDINAHTEYLWRWFGPDYSIRSITLGFRFDLPRPKSVYPGVPSSE